MINKLQLLRFLEERSCEWETIGDGEDNFVTAAGAYARASEAIYIKTLIEAGTFDMKVDE